MNVEREIQSLLESAELYIEDAFREEDLREAAEKAYLAVTLAIDALLMSKGLLRPKSLYARKSAIGKISKELGRTYSSIVEDLHRSCFYDGQCDEGILKVRMGEARELVKRIISELIKA